jgi:lambda repressor-like predicted transcriptional regulator
MSYNRERVPVEPLRYAIAEKGWTAGQVAERTGLSLGSIQRIYATDTIWVITADRVACRLGWNPVEIWGLQWWEAA